MYCNSVVEYSTFNYCVQGFSISRIAGALCDEGQNYKNLVGFFKGLRKLKIKKAIMYACRLILMTSSTDAATMYKSMTNVWGCKEKFH